MKTSHLLHHSSITLYKDGILSSLFLEVDKPKSISKNKTFLEQDKTKPNQKLRICSFKSCRRTTYDRKFRLLKFLVMFYSFCQPISSINILVIFYSAGALQGANGSMALHSSPWYINKSWLFSRDLSHYTKVSHRVKN